MARLETTVQVIRVDLVALDDQDLRILDLALAMLKDADNASGAWDEEHENNFPKLLEMNDRLALNALHDHVLNAKKG